MPQILGMNLVPRSGGQAMTADLVDGVGPVGPFSTDGSIQTAPHSKRPRLTGEPLGIGPGRTVPKPRALIELVEAGPERLSLTDRRLVNVLIAASWRRLGRGLDGPFEAPAERLRYAIGQGGRSDNGRLRASLGRLRDIALVDPRAVPSRDVAVPLLSAPDLRIGSHRASWTFSFEHWRHLFEPHGWARLDLDACAAFRSRNALVLYEHFALRVNRRWPTWWVRPELLRRYLGLTDKLPGMGEMMRVAVRPALAEIATRTPLRVEVKCPDPYADDTLIFVVRRAPAEST